jgi:hypothetical protein
MLTPYGGEMRDEPSYAELLLMYWIFGTAVSMERRTFTESFERSCVSEGKETREKGGHQTAQRVLDVVISGKHEPLSTT